MLEPYVPLLARLRQDAETWSDVAFVPIYDEKKRMEDLNYRKRYGVLLCLQYDRNDQDYPLLRYLLEEEVKSRHSDPFQGESSALFLASYLLACFRKVEDVWLIWKAKVANFDTYCSMDTRYLFAVGIPETLEYIEQSDRPERKGMLDLLLDSQKGLGVPTSARMQQFWSEKHRAFPANPADEEPLTLVYRAMELDTVEEGRYWLDRWEADQAVSAEILHTLMRARSGLDQPDRALVCARQLLEQAGANVWKQASAQFDVGHYAVLAGDYEQAWTMLEQIIEALDAHPARQIMGQQMATVELALSLSEAAPEEHPLRRQAFTQVHLLLQRGFASSYNTLKKMTALAQSLDEESLEWHYHQLAEEEYRRIRGEV